MRQVWDGLVREPLRRSCEKPSWLNCPALLRLTISSLGLLAPFDDLNAGKAWPDCVKPFDFLLVGHVRPFGYPVGVDHSRFQPIAPFESDPSKWHDLPGSIGIEWDRLTNVVIPRSCSCTRDVERAFRTHPEVKSADADGTVCDRRTVGLLQRRVVQEISVAHVGKEAKKIEEVESGIERDPDVI